MKIALSSDFTDYYDHWFAASHEPHSHILERRSTGGPTKREQFALFDQIGLNTPVHGLVDDVVPRLQCLSNFVNVVVYTDETLHCGMGKMLMSGSEALRTNSGCYCSAWVQTTKDYLDTALSYRYLQIGDRAWWLKYFSDDSWQSNNGRNVQIQVTHEAIGFWEPDNDIRPLAQYPIYAIDFVVPLGTERTLAIDFNISPGLKHTGIENILSAKDVYNLIECWFVLKGVSCVNPRRESYELRDV